MGSCRTRAALNLADALFWKRIEGILEIIELNSESLATVQVIEECIVGLIGFV